MNNYDEVKHKNIIEVSDNDDLSSAEKNSEKKENSDSDETLATATESDELDMSSCGYFMVGENPDEPFDIKVEINPMVGKPPREYVTLYNNIEFASSIIKSLDNTDENTKRRYFKKLLSLAQAGLVSKGANPELAEDSLEKLKEEIVISEGRRIKNKYMKSLGLEALIIAMVSLLAYAAICYWFENNEIASLMLLGVGAMMGTWVSFGARKMQIKFEELALMEKDMMEPLIRLLFIYTSTIIFAFFLITGIVQVKIGTVDTSNIISDYKVPLIIGIICGLVESRIGVRVYRQASGIIGKDE